MARITHHGSIRKKGKGYEIRLSVAGNRHSFMFTGTFTQAASYANTKYAELAEKYGREARGLPGDMPVSELIERFRAEYMPGRSAGTQRSYSDALKPITRYFVEARKDPLIQHIGKGDVTAFVSWRRGHRIQGEKVIPGKVSERTVQKDRTVLHTLLQYAVDLEVLDSNPVALTQAPKVARRTPVIPSEERYEALLRECRASRQPMLFLYALTLGESGARSESEALWLRWRDVDLDGGFIWIDSDPEHHETKGREGRWTPMTPRLHSAMREHFARYRFARYGGKPTPWVFHHTSTRRHHRAGERIVSMRESFKNAARRAGLPAKFGQHDLRHRRVTTWLAEGANPVHVKEAVGHSDLQTTMWYTHLSREHLRSLVDSPPAHPAEEGESTSAPHPNRDQRGKTRGKTGSTRRSVIA